MQFGHFDDEKREYVIETPATPLPWINYLGNEDFFSLISNTGGGYSFYKDAKLRRITRYRYNGVPGDNGARNYYLSLMSGSGEDATPVATWSPTFLPVKTPLDSYECRHGIGYTTFHTDYQGIESTLTAFVPLHTAAEINHLSVRNNTGEAVTVDVTGCMEWCLWNVVDDASNFQRNLSTGEVEVEQTDTNTIVYHKTEFKERRNHYAFFSVNEPTVGFDTSRDEFLGQFNSWDSPQAIAEGRMRDSVAHGWYPIAAERVRLTLQPGEERMLVFMLGYIEVPDDQKWEDPNDPAKVGIINKQPAHELFARFNTSERVLKALDELSASWDGLLGRFQVSTGDGKLDRMVNIWNQYQCMVTFNLSRSASYYESGMGRGMGFRDSNQDLLGFVHMIPGRARSRILDIAATQLPDGSAWHQYQPLTKKGNADIGGGFNDDPLWLVAGVFAYLNETGDDSILREPTQFDNQEGSEQPLLEHLRRSVHFTMTHRGPHGLPLIGRADWNDCLNLNCFSSTPGESFQTVENNDTGIAESVFIAGMFVLYGEQYAQILERFGEACGMEAADVQAEAAAVRAAIGEVREATLTAGWDGAWFRRAYDANGNPVGTNEDSEGKIYIEPQGMCVMAGIGADDGKAAQALRSTKDLLTCRWGTAILAPAYSTYRIELGEISSYPRGYKENGGIFCHNNPWISIANATIGNDDEAFNVYTRTCPAYVEQYSEVHRTEPYVYCQMVAGPEAPTPGEGKNSWLTGTAAWTFVDVSQHLLGVQPTFDGLRLEPHLPAQFTELHIEREWRGVRYVIDATRTGKASLAVDGKPVSGTTVPIAAPGTEEVHVSLNF
ncbi:GH36-type glycosyl hydrolase domain-containing protein [Bifidobacterium pseudolongum]|uniref:GH36-type glycosyl hydrolase domain-containing protein n=1 Tax=Bifidobacterium pseudolongum TaxID=1694 RepID=UPI0010210154|nr:glycosyl transferase [Bifidobacterium pseudolongum]RYQ06430.1 glycosyl transferase [Bifidobacterium pseudolongum subsp. globosum]RYQ13225.1 glycosyl transferase [Bifidobacterium pseudolongum subsp. globosum]RYQ67796.1 glycosyl transferase [Bifidobacterium pseudolongum subsp. globosum]